MRATAEAIRKRFISHHGQIAFESAAKVFAEYGSNQSSIDLSSVPEWRVFATALRVIPRGEVLHKAFLWCIRHRSPLEPIQRPASPPSLDRIENSDIIAKLFEYFPFFIANSQDGFRCEKCFDLAAQLIVNLLATGEESNFELILEHLVQSHSLVVENGEADDADDL